MSGGATANACKMLIPRLVKIGAHLLNCAESEARFENGKVIGPSGSVGLAEITEAWYLRPERLPKDADSAGLEASVAFKPKVDTGAFSYASHAVAVAVDTDTGQIEILDYVIVEDCGTLVNPMVVEGQTLGGVAQGIGTAMYEEMQYDVNGQPKASTFADYLLPGPTEVPALRIFHIETPSPYTAFGIKGMGEGGAIAPPAVIINAVNNALTPMGVEINETPVTPERVLAAIDKAKSVPKREAA
jgi:carbon-monoxide dehydrogenase large subunit